MVDNNIHAYTTHVYSYYLLLGYYAKHGHVILYEEINASSMANLINLSGKVRVYLLLILCVL